jgi:hypothetical protein
MEKTICYLFLYSSATFFKVELQFERVNIFLISFSTEHASCALSHKSFYSCNILDLKQLKFLSLASFSSLV